MSIGAANQDMIHGLYTIGVELARRGRVRDPPWQRASVVVGIRFMQAFQIKQVTFNDIILSQTVGLSTIQFK